MPGDLLAFAQLATGVRDGDLVDADAAAEHLGRELGLEVEAVGLESDAVEHAAIEQLVARLHVGQRAVVEHVRDERQEPVADPVQEQHVATFAGEARAVDDARAALEDGREQPRPVLGVVLEVGVLHEDKIARRALEAGADRSPLAPVLGMRDDADGAVAQLRQDGAGPVVAAVVDDDDLAFDGQLHRPHPAHDLRDSAALVEDGDDDRQRAEPGVRGLVANAVLAHALSRTTRRCGRDLRGGRPRGASRAHRSQA